MPVKYKSIEKTTSVIKYCTFLSKLNREIKDKNVVFYLELRNTCKCIIFLRLKSKPICDKPSKVSNNVIKTFTLLTHNSSNNKIVNNVLVFIKISPTLDVKTIAFIKGFF